MAPVWGMGPASARPALDPPPGTQIWASRLDDPNNGFDGGAGLAVAPDGTRVYAAGWVEGNGGLDFETVAYAVPTGRLIWSSQFDTGGYDEALAIVLSPDGSRLYVTGLTSVGASDIGTVAYDAASGDQLWSAIYDDPLDSFDLAFAIALTPDGDSVFVAGTTSQLHGTSPSTVIAYDASTGAQRWIATSSVEGDFYALGVSPDGTVVFASGECCQDTRDDYLTAAYDTQTGATEWEAQYDGPGHGQDAALGLAVGREGTRVFVTGFSHGISHDQFGTIAYDAASGKQLWVSRYDGQEHQGGNGHAIGISPDGSLVYVTGEAFTRLSNYGTVAYDAGTGIQVWASEYHVRGGYTIPSDLAVAPDGSGVYVTGDGEYRSSFFYLTVAYDPATGGRRWASRYTGPGRAEDDAQAVATTPDGKVVLVTGESYGPTDADFATVAYQA